MSTLTKGLILLLAVLGIGAGLVVWKSKVGGHAEGSFNTISKGEVEMLLADVAKVNPMVLKRLAQDPSMKKEQLENIKQLLAFASQAQKEGLADDPNNRRELENIRAEVEAVNYDKEINKDKGPMPPFGFITEDRIKEFWGEGDNAPQGAWASFKNKIGLGPANHELEFNKFLDTKVALMKAGNPQMKDREITDEERNQAKDFFAKIQIYKDEYEDKRSQMPKEFNDKVDLQVKLQQAQFLARLYSEKAADKIKVTDEEVAKYVSEHPELDPGKKKAQAEEILARAKNGEDFAALANQFSEDPGNKDPKTGEGKGGLYADTPKGRMVAPFEAAALALEPGQIAPNLVETDYGYHIIKLENKKETKDAQGQPTVTYDVRHILISTGVKDPENPAGRDMPIKAYVNSKLQADKEKQFIDDIVASNHVSVPDDFDVPEVSDEQIQEMMKQQMPGGMPGAPDGEAPPPSTGKEVPKKADSKKK
ncbi:MAG TPA: peptidylprolyl isomerase [Pyrinomonadaceae bacterium]|nr:peptidylprolyl isomerase [Pyrinomonadaceae bacterium]